MRIFQLERVLKVFRYQMHESGICTVHNFFELYQLRNKIILNNMYSSSFIRDGIYLASSVTELLSINIQTIGLLLTMRKY